MDGLTKKRVAKYAILPGILPRLMRLLGPGRGLLASSIAYVFNAVRILPNTHAYLRPHNRGNFGVKHVVAEAANNITWDLKHADQILVFFTILTGLAMFILQFVVLGLSLFTVPALALTNYAGIYIPTDPFEVFITPFPEQDVAFILLDLVFGIPEMFNSCVMTGAQCLDTRAWPLPYEARPYPTPFQVALHETLAFYCYGLFLVGVLLIIYFTITTVGETAAYGTPFGRRFNKLWAPVRLIFFFFLIVPIVYNLNIAQMGVLHAARIGSSMATNLWLTFNDGLDIMNSTIIGEELWVGRPNVPELGGLLQFMQTATACKYAERILHNRFIQPYLVRHPGPGEVDGARFLDLQPPEDVITSPRAPGPEQTYLRDALLFHNNGDIVIRFGEYNPDLYPTEKGHVYPWCGEIVLVNPGVVYQDLAEGGGLTGVGSIAEGVNISMYAAVIGYYEQVILLGWHYTDFHEYGSNIARNILLNEENPIPDTQDLVALLNLNKQAIDQLIEAALELEATYQAENWNRVPDFIRDKGWAGAAIWYNFIAELNGGFTAAIHGIPQPSRWPDALEQILEQRRANNQDSSGSDQFNPVLGDGRVAKFNRPEDADVARVERFAYMLWQNEATAIQSVDAGGGDREHLATSNPFIDSINAIFGTTGLFELRSEHNQDVHPLAQLSMVGKSLVDSSLNAFGFSVGITFGGLLGILNNAPGSMADSMSSIAMTVATTGLLVGFLLYYVLPFMPFLYFFFAVGGWIKAIFEAMVGLPLWALAHIRIDGEGLPGTAGMNGYFLIFEIVVRPSLIIFGLVASVTIMAASVRILNEIFDLVVINMTGHKASAATNDPLALAYYRNAVSQLFYTILYAITVYMTAVSCFKLIDLVPDQIMRWLGSSVPGFGDAEKESAGHLLRTTSTGAMMVGSQLGQVGGMAKGALLGHFFGRQ